MQSSHLGRNKAIHIIFIPTILVTAIAMLHHSSLALAAFNLGGLKVTVDIGFLILSVLLPIYVIVDTVTGVSLSILTFSLPQLPFSPAAIC